MRSRTMARSTRSDSTLSFIVRFSLILLLAVTLFGGISMAQSVSIREGARAPGFTLNDQHRKAHELKDYLGRWLVIYFYPKDDTPGCTAEACAIRDDYLAFREMGVAVVGISTDDEASHAQFSEKHGLPFPLLADIDGKVAERYGALWSFGPMKFSRRHSFIIDDRGTIAKIYRKVDPAAHSAQLIKDLNRLKRESRGAYVPG